MLSKVTKNMGNVVKNIESVSKLMENGDITKTMDKFEKISDDLDVKIDFVDKSMSESTNLSIPTDEVNELMAQVADQHNLKLKEKLKPKSV
jgi:charged multivesicular body protein 1